MKQTDDSEEGWTDGPFEIIGLLGLGVASAAVIPPGAEAVSSTKDGEGFQDRLAMEVSFP